MGNQLECRPSNEVPNLGLGPKWDQSPNLVPKKSQFCMQVPKSGINAQKWSPKSVKRPKSGINAQKRSPNSVNFAINVAMTFNAKLLRLHGF